MKCIFEKIESVAHVVHNKEANSFEQQSDLVAINYSIKFFRVNFPEVLNGRININAPFLPNGDWAKIWKIDKIPDDGRIDLALHSYFSP